MATSWLPFRIFSAGPEKSSSLQVTVFSIGMTDVCRSESLGGDEARRITIPVKSAGVLASLCRYGDVALSATPTFRAEDKASEVIDGSTKNGLVSEIRLLSGAGAADRLRTASTLALPIDEALSDFRWAALLRQGLDALKLNGSWFMHVELCPGALRALAGLAGAREGRWHRFHRAGGRRRDDSAVKASTVLGAGG